MKKVRNFILIFLILLFCINVLADNININTKIGDVGQGVFALQEKLSNLNYLKAKPSGNFKQKTKLALERFQKDYNLAINGIADEATIAALEQAKYRILRLGDTGSDVKALQEKLIEIGYKISKATGNYGRQTKNAVQNFQKDKDIDTSGVADLETLNAIFGTNYSVKISDALSVEDGRGTNQFIAFKKKLRRGAEGTDVKKVQEKLKTLGFFDGPISGYYMNQTVAAVEKFQSYNGLDADGVTDDKTWNKLLNDSQVVDIHSTPAPTPEPVLPKYSLTVDVTNQAVLVYEKGEDNSYSKLVRKMICSTGTVATPSDVGEWVLNGRKASWCYFPTWGSHARYWTQINKYIAFHSVIYNAVDFNAMSLKSYRKLGSRASHGCIRLLVDDAKWIYDNVEKGTVVNITEDLPRDEELKFAIKQPPLNKNKTGPVKTKEPIIYTSFNSSKMPEFELRDLKKGMSGEDVYWLQSALKELGFYKGTITGSLYSGTVKAIKDFQSSINTYPSGKADIEMQRTLYNLLIEKNNQLNELKDQHDN